MPTTLERQPKTKTRTRSRAPRRSRSVDPVTAYALRVLSWRRAPRHQDGQFHWERRFAQAVADYRATVGEVEPIVAGRAVRLACERHFYDLSRQRTTDFPYFFDVDAAQHIIDFFPEFLTLENGAAFHLPAWLQFSYGSIFGWKRVSDGLRRFIHGFFETSKGSGKTPSAGGIGLYGVAFDGESFAEIYSTGFDKGQASIILNDAIRMANASPDLREILDVGKYNIAHEASGSYMRAMSSEHRSKSGPRASYVLSDEIHEHRDGTVVGKAEDGFKHRKQPLGLKYTNSGSDKTSYCWQLHEKSLQVLDGTLTDEQFFAYVCHLDPCDACYGEGYRQPKDACPHCDDWLDPAVWPKVAPALGVVIQPKYLQDQIDKALTIPSEFARVRRLNFCIWTETHQIWIPSDKLDACRVDQVSDGNPRLLPCALGLDPSSTLDLTSLVAAIRYDDPPSRTPAEQVIIDGQDEHGQQVRLVYTLNFHVEIVPFFWIPEATLHERVRKERIPYDVWLRAGHLFVTPGPAIDHNAIYDFIIGAPRGITEAEKLGAWKRFKAQRLGMDENQGRFLFMRLQSDGKLGDKVISVGQGKKLSEAFKFIEILIAHKRLRHAGNPVWLWNFANAEPQRDRIGALWIEKPSEVKRIDGAVATAMAIKELMALPARRSSGGVFFV